MSNGNTHIRLDQDLTDQMTVNKNLSQEIIVTNTDKVTILLLDHHKIVRRKVEWLGPLGIFLSILATLLTAKFEETKFGISPELWKAIFIVLCFVSLATSIYFIIIALCYLKRGTVEEFIRKLKNESVKQGLIVAPSSEQIQAISILSATYLWAGGQVDVTSKISELVSTGITTIMVDPSTFGIADPAHGILKTLKIHCRIDGVEREFSHTDGQRFRLQ